jgi:hypothetical protein
MAMDEKPRAEATQAIRRACKDLAIIIVVLSFMFASTIYAFERFAEGYQKEGVAPIDEIKIVLAILACAFAIFALRRWRELQEVLGDIKTLRGLLPLCASCKKIRDDKGYWNQLEAYILNHSDAKITHGICPECMKQLYGDFLEEDSNSKGIVSVEGQGISALKGVAGPG